MYEFVVVWPRILIFRWYIMEKESGSVQQKTVLYTYERAGWSQSPLELSIHDSLPKNFT